jgi:pimeloyl-ACP methyl ester carboxylesterase
MGYKRDSSNYEKAYQEGAEDGYEYSGKLIHIDELQQIYTEKRGEGPPIIFIPGYGGDGAFFLYLADFLSDEFTVITYDRRGNSRSPRGWFKVTLEEQADDIAKLLDAFKIERTLVISSSNGGSVAFKLMLLHPDRILGAVLHEPFWSPSFMSDPLPLYNQSEINTKKVQVRREKDCGDLEGRLRYLNGDSLFDYFSANTRRRMSENTETGSIEREVFSQWTPTPTDWEEISKIPLNLLLGKDTLPMFVEAIHSIEKFIGKKALMVPGGHSGLVVYAEEIGSLIRPILHKYCNKES